MKKKINEIIEKINKIADDRRKNAATAPSRFSVLSAVTGCYAGSCNDGGAAQIEAELDWFMDGYNSAVMMCFEHPDKFHLSFCPVEVPKKWQDFFHDEDPEYELYLKLKDKFQK